MKLFNSLSVLALISVAYAMPEDDHSDLAKAAVVQDSSEGDGQDRFFGGGYPFGYGPGLVNANVGVGGLANVGASVLGPNGVANVGANVGGLVGLGVGVLGPNGIANVNGHVLGLPIGVNVGGPGWGGYPGYGGYPPYGGGYPPYGGGYPPYGGPSPPYGGGYPPYGGPPPPYGGYPRY